MLNISFTVLAQEDVVTRSDKLSAQKTNLISLIDKRPLTDEDHANIKAYFSELKSLDKDLGLSFRYLKRFQTYLMNVGAATFCANSLLEKNKWTELVKRCTKNGFFLCTDEVKVYPDIKQSLFGKLNEELKTEMGKYTECEI